MSETENSQPQDDSDEDIYKDIPEFNFEDELAKLEGSKETYKQEASDLSEQVKTLTQENKELKKSNEVLKKNLSTLLKTAQAEVQRKDSMINELRTKVDSITFRRNKTQTKDKYTSTDDLIIYSEAKYELDKPKSFFDKKRSKSCESWTSSDSERKFNLEVEKRKEFSTGRENSSCDNFKNLREKSRTKSKHSDSSHSFQDDRFKGRKSSRCKDRSNYRRSFRENHRDHLKHDSYDKKRHSRSSDRRFFSNRKNSRERRGDHKKEDNSERRKSRGSSERSEKKNSRRHRSPSKGSKESFEKPKIKSSFKDKDLDVRIKEQNYTKKEISDRVKNSIEMVENKNQNNFEKQTSQEKETSNNIKNKPNKEKRSDVDLFGMKSPLDALYNEMMISRNPNRFSDPKSVTSSLESDLEEGELGLIQPVNTGQDTPKNQEDWTFSFKNERQKETKPMTLYSKRMMLKFSSESKVIGRTEVENMKASKEENEKVDKIEFEEKEPGELTDDENIVESSKEFQELTKVASIENEIIGQFLEENTFNDPTKKEFLKLENVNCETKENPKEVEKLTSERVELNACKDVEQNKETHEVIEFSPFKNNYKLIEIAPIKPSRGEHVLDFYNKKPFPSQFTEPNAPNLSEGCNKSFDTFEKKELWKNSSSEKESEMELKIVVSETEKEKKLEMKKESRQNFKKINDEELKDSKKESTPKKEKRKSARRKDAEKSVVDEKTKRNKRKLSKTEEESSDSKKRKTEKSELPRKSERVKRNSKSEPETIPEPEFELDKRVNEDISSFEFFKPIAKAEIPQTPVEVEKPISTTTDYTMTATMSVTGVVRLETPNKCVEKLKNLMINEQMIFNVLDSKTNSQFSPLIGSKCIEMTPRRMLKNDLMLTDSEDDSVIKKNITESDEAEEEEQMSGIESSECGSDSGASDFVDLL